jgi:membrane protein YqaA with SNARE-associated domain
MTDYILLFGASFLAATVLPFYSEIVLYLLIDEGASPLLLLLIATSGNTLGAVVNWGLGRYLLHYQDRRWFPATPSQIERAQAWFQRRGVWTLLLAWLPIGGDALTVVAGIMRVRLPLFLILVGLGKSVRYAIVIAAALA